MTASPVHDPLSGGGKVGSTATLGDLSGLKSATFDMVDGGPFDADKAYKDSKLCNLLFTAEASRRLAKKNAKATAPPSAPASSPHQMVFSATSRSSSRRPSMRSRRRPASRRLRPSAGRVCRTWRRRRCWMRPQMAGGTRTPRASTGRAICLPRRRVQSTSRRSCGGCPRGWWGWRSKFELFS